MRATAEFQTKLLDRMGSVAEFGHFLNTDAGERFLTAIATEPGGGLAQQRVLRAVQSGIVMVCLGIGIFMYLGQVNLESESFESVGFVGTVSTAVGLGLLISGYVSLLLSRRMGLLDGRSHPPTSKESARSL